MARAHVQDPANPLSLRAEQALPYPERARREEVLRSYLEQVRERGHVSADIAGAAWAAWQKLRDATDHQLMVPNAGAGPNGEILLSWDLEEHHFELELSPAEPPYYFYRNRVSGKTWGAEQAYHEPVPAAAVERLRTFKG